MKRVFSCVVAASLALSLLVGCGASSTASSAASSAASSEAASSVASSAAETAALADGVYTAEFDTDSSMFHANEACDGKGTLTVENGQMTFHVSLASTHIVNLYPVSYTHLDVYKRQAQLLAKGVVAAHGVDLLAGILGHVGHLVEYLPPALRKVAAGDIQTGHEQVAAGGGLGQVDDLPHIARVHIGADEQQAGLR